MAHGEIHEEVWMDDFMDLGRFSIGNCFKTEEEAKFYIEKLKVIAELKRFNKPFEKEGVNYYYCLGDNYENVEIGCHYFNKSGHLYFESKEKAEEAIQSVGEERVKKYYLEVE